VAFRPGGTRFEEFARETQDSELAANFAKLRLDLASKEGIPDRPKGLDQQLLTLY